MPSFVQNKLMPYIMSCYSVSKTETNNNEPETNDDNQIAAQITQTQTGYTVEYFYHISHIKKNMPETDTTISQIIKIFLKQPIQFSVRFNLVKEKSEWKAVKTQFILLEDSNVSDVVTTGNRLDLDNGKEEI